MDESYLPPEIIPKEGVKYFDTFDWEFTVTKKEQVRQRMRRPAAQAQGKLVGLGPGLAPHRCQSFEDIGIGEHQCFQFAAPVPAAGHAGNRFDRMAEDRIERPGRQDEIARQQD